MNTTTYQNLNMQILWFVKSQFKKPKYAKPLTHKFITIIKNPQSTKILTNKFHHNHNKPQFCKNPNSQISSQPKKPKYRKNPNHNLTMEEEKRNQRRCCWWASSLPMTYVVIGEVAATSVVEVAWSKMSHEVGGKGRRVMF